MSTYLINGLYKGLDNNWKRAVVFLHLRKAFDTVLRRRLLLNLNNIASDTIPWKYSNLFRRSNVCVSTNIAANKTLLDPSRKRTGANFIFNYINRVAINRKLILFDDDRAIMFRNENWEKLKVIVVDRLLNGLTQTC